MYLVSMKIICWSFSYVPTLSLSFGWKFYTFLGIFLHVHFMPRITLFWPFMGLVFELGLPTSRPV